MRSTACDRIALSARERVSLVLEQYYIGDEHYAKTMAFEESCVNTTVMDFMYSQELDVMAGSKPGFRYYPKGITTSNLEPRPSTGVSSFIVIHHQSSFIIERPRARPRRFVYR